MGAKRGIVSSRHRIVENQFYSAITYVNNDLITFNEVYGVKVVEFEIMGGAFTGPFSNYNFIDFRDGSRIRFNPSNSIENRLIVTIGGLQTLFSGIVYFNNGALLDVHRYVISFNFVTGDIMADYYINNVLESSGTRNNSNLISATLQPETLGTSNVNAGVKSIKFTTTSDDVINFKMNESSGFLYTDESELFTMTGSTANPSGSTYWDNNVITPL